jgi:hypothetical protein
MSWTTIAPKSCNSLIYTSAHEFNGLHVGAFEFLAIAGWPIHLAKILGKLGLSFYIKNAVFLTFSMHIELWEKNYAYSFVEQSELYRLLHG